MTATLERPRSSRPHPRIEERRREIRRDEDHRRRNRLVAVAVVLAVLALAAGVTRTPLLDVDHVEVSGTRAVPPRAVRFVAGVPLGKPMTSVDLDAVRARVALLPRVDTVSVRRRWPGTVAIAVTERVPVAAVGARGGGWLVVDDTGRVVDKVQQRPAGVLGVPAHDPAEPAGQVARRLQPAIDVATAVQGELRRQVRSVRVGSGGEVDLALAGGGTARLGPTTDLVRKLSVLATILQAADQCATVDLRVPSAPVLTPGKRCA